jgi:hypothetical protein
MAYGTLARLIGEQAAGGQTAGLSASIAPVGMSHGGKVLHLHVVAAPLTATQEQFFSP